MMAYSDKEKYESKPQIPTEKKLLGKAWFHL